jgi:multicomponent Na+:H+ antiporter subunit B
MWERKTSAPRLLLLSVSRFLGPIMTSQESVEFMSSLILSTATRYLMPLLLLFSVFLLLRGHNEPGGGFVGGLAAAAAFALYAIAFGVEPTRRMLWIRPRVLMGIGLVLAAASGMLAVTVGLPYMTGMWSSLELPAVGKLGTPLIFDVGVYLVVLGMVLMIIFELAEN